MTSTPAYLLAPQVSARFSWMRISRLYAELAFALSRLERDALKGWGARSAGRLLMLAGRRVGGLARLATLLARAGGGEALGVLAAFRQHRLATHMGDRAAAAIDGTVALGRDGARLIAAVSRALIRDPRAAAPAVLGGLLGFGAGSGGLDGNGGIPDLDLLAGVGAHRSPLTHTIVAGIVAEGLLLALADLSAEVHGKLPIDHDPLWDSLARVGRPLTQSLAIGTSAGLAYHLLADAMVQPGAYHDIPIDMPLAAHQSVQGANGLVEGIDASVRARSRFPVDIVKRPCTQERTTGRKVVDTAGDTFAVVGTVVASGTKTLYSVFSSGKRRE